MYIVHKWLSDGGRGKSIVEVLLAILNDSIESLCTAVIQLMVP